MKKKFILALMLVLVTVTLSGCVPGSEKYTMQDPANILSGIWHGWIAPFTLIASFFSGDIKMYEVINTGFSYDLGFYMAIIAGFGSISFSRKKKKD
ncbi:MAG: hypothetical protein WBA54_02460 [Acidaminobacteraceae bacterium]